MIIRKMYPEQYEQACHSLKENGKSSVMDASYEETREWIILNIRFGFNPAPKGSLPYCRQLRFFTLRKKVDVR